MRMNKAVRALRYLLLAASMSVAAVQASGLRIGPGPLEQALLEFSRQSGVQLVFSSSLVAGKHSAGLTSGETDTAKSLAALLRGSGLHAEPIDHAAFVLKPDARRETAAPKLPALDASDMRTVELSGVRTDALLPRTAYETSQPITVIDRQRIELSGFQTLYELLRAQPGIRAGSVPVATGDTRAYLNSGLAGATGAASVSLHGIAGATPILVNGQRLVSYALTEGQFGTTTDLNSIPLAMVERVEILREGAPVLYGADAMAGAVNIVLKRRFEGADLSASSGISSRGDGAVQHLSGTFGKAWSSNAGHLVFSFDYLDRQPILNRQRPWSDRNGFLDEADSDSSLLGNSGFSYIGRPCKVYRSDDPCQEHPDALATLQSRLQSHSLLLHADRRSGSTSFSGDLRWAWVESQQQNPPATAPTDEPAPGFRYKTYSFEDIGPMLDRTGTRTLQLDLGANGQIGEWSWNVLLDGQKNRGIDRLHGLIIAPELWPPEAAYEPGVTNSAATIAAISPDLVRHGQADRFGLSTRLNGPIGETPDGDIDVTIGAEVHHEKLTDHPDPLLLSGKVFQEIYPQRRSDRRWTSAAYAELQLPVTKKLSADIGLRLERNQGYRSGLAPRTGVKWELRDWITLRGSWALSYRAPPLLSLEQSGASSTLPPLAAFLPASMLPCQNGYGPDMGRYTCYLHILDSSPSRLRAERSRGSSIGVVLAPTDNFGLTLDVFQLSRYREIAPLPVTYALSYPDQFPEAFVRNEQGELYALRQQLINIGQTRLRTLDMNAVYHWKTASHGDITFNMDVNWMMQLKRQVLANRSWEQLAGHANQPRVTALASTEWRAGNWLLAANLRYVAHTTYTPYKPYPNGSQKDIFCTSTPDPRHCGAPAFTLVDANLNYSGWRNLAVGFHVHNLFDHQPRFSSASPLAYSTSFDDILGRYYQLSLRYRY